MLQDGLLWTWLLLTNYKLKVRRGAKKCLKNYKLKLKRDVENPSPQTSCIREQYAQQGAAQTRESVCDFDF